MQNPYKSNAPKRNQKHQITSNDLKRAQKIEILKLVSNYNDAVSTSQACSAKRLVNKKGKKGCGDIEIVDENLDEILNNFEL